MLRVTPGRLQLAVLNTLGTVAEAVVYNTPLAARDQPAGAWHGDGDKQPRQPGDHSAPFCDTLSRPVLSCIPIPDAVFCLCQVTIDGEDAENMNQLVRQVAYLNTR